jgi:hypothetical protein
VLPICRWAHSAGDPCAPVAAAADAAIACICTHCGYEGSLSRLLSENADYVVDGVCARLRAMSPNSRWAANCVRQVVLASCSLYQRESRMQATSSHCVLTTH